MIKFQIDPTKKFQAALDKAARDTSDLTVPLTLIAQSWFKSNRAIFALKGPGKYTDLSEKYMEQKERRWGFAYPILKAKGDLEESITNPAASDAVNKILNKKTLVLGSKDPKAAWHQFGTSRMPSRPMVLIGAEQVAPPELNRRLEAWVQMLGDYVVQKAKTVG